ncbi:hypothetical protein HF086_014343 [Spodoptera exigua]|uniref:Deoxyribonuclease TATDN1 n=1 Tax=Spodoptera exigua TaxID=7107 RepID=A0A922M8A8_SPOEX|nr:hypothetical protein HF086_014343 [Spodoptera exigua]
MIETDCPWCEVKPTHPGYTHVLTKFSTVKKEKYSVGQVLEILAAVRKENIDELAAAIYDNTNKFFFNK